VTPKKIVYPSERVTVPKPGDNEKPALLPELAAACNQAMKLPRNTLLGYAVARGCFHYAPFVPPELRSEVGDFPHEVLGCVLMVGPEDVDTFQSIRCGAMVISDLRNSPAVIVAVARFLGVENRVRHVARLGLSGDTHPEFCRTIVVKPRTMIFCPDFHG
jgi:hypothetical protein